jgi:hypothetical protein
MLEDTDGFTEVALGTPDAKDAFSNIPQQNHGLLVQFYIHPQLDQDASAEEGRPIYKDREYIRLRVIGDKASLVERPVRLGFDPKCDNVRFRKEYDAYKQNREVKLEGTPLAQWPPISKGQIKELEHFGVKTVEQLSTMSDTHVQGFMGIMSLRNLARRYMEHAKGLAPMTRMQSDLSKAVATANAQAQQLNEMAVELAALKGEKPKQVAKPLTEELSPSKVKSPVVEPNDADALYNTPAMSFDDETVKNIDEPTTDTAAETPTQENVATKPKAKRSVAK